MLDNPNTESGTFEYPTASTTFDVPSPTTPKLPFPLEEPAETPVKVPLNRPDLVEESEEQDDVDFLPYFGSHEALPQKSYYLRELEAEESDEERLN